MANLPEQMSDGMMVMAGLGIPEKTAKIIS
jgi:hypothetical protein